MENVKRERRRSRFVHLHILIDQATHTWLRRVLRREQRTRRMTTLSDVARERLERQRIIETKSTGA